MTALRHLSRAHRLAALPALGLVVCLFLPWYRASSSVNGALRTDDRTALGSFTLVEAALLVVAFSVLYLLWARAHERGFHLPGGDGWAITIAGGWAMALCAWRLFDMPDVANGSVGVSWGIFVALAMAGALLAAGQRLRAAHVAEPPNPAATAEQPVARRHAPRPVAAMPSREAARTDLGEDAGGPFSRAAARADLHTTDAHDAEPPAPAPDDTAVTRPLPPPEDAPTRALPADDGAPTRRLPADSPPPPPPPPPPRTPPPPPPPEG